MVAAVLVVGHLTSAAVAGGLLVWRALAETLQGLRAEQQAQTVAWRVVTVPQEPRKQTSVVGRGPEMQPHRHWRARAARPSWAAAAAALEGAAITWAARQAALVGNLAQRLLMQQRVAQPQTPPRRERRALMVAAHLSALRARAAAGVVSRRQEAMAASPVVAQAAVLAATQAQAQVAQEGRAS
jgi:hypothetical protein